VTHNNLFSLVSLGCPKNRVDAERILSVMISGGYVYTEDVSRAHVMIVNTCAFIEPAVEESIDTILDHQAENPSAILVVAGCLPLRYKDGLREPLPEVDLFLTPSQINELPRILTKLTSRQCDAGRHEPAAVSDPCQLAEGSDLVARGAMPQVREVHECSVAASAHPPRILTTSGYAYLKIAEGCSRTCRYCTIPAIRGPLTSVDPAELEKEARFLASLGVRELVLVAQDLTSYGLDRGEKNALARLLDRIQQVEGIKWIRLMYLYPGGITPDVVKVVTDSPVILPYLDIPFQHVSDTVLQAMGRPWKGDRIRKLVQRLREDIPGLVLRTTLMVGYPAERDTDFRELRDFVTSFEIERVGVFAYSPEEGSRAHALGDPVPDEVKLARADEIRSIHASFTKKRNRKRKGRVEDALIEGVSQESELLLQGRTWDQAPEVDGVLYITSGNAVAGEIHSVKITGCHGPDLFGEVI
jgi:ribosomal protein S12 methylthiotransferase